MLPHASYEPTYDDAARLLQQAVVLDALAERKREEARELAREAIELRVQAESITREPLTMVAVAASRHPARSIAEDTRFLDRIVAALEAGPLAMPALADHVGASPARVRKAVARLEAIGTVVKTGATRGTRYALAEDDDAGQAEPVAAAPAAPIHLRVLSTTHPTAHELRDRDVAWTTAAPAEAGDLPERDGDD